MPAESLLSPRARTWRAGNSHQQQLDVKQIYLRQQFVLKIKFIKRYFLGKLTYFLPVFNKVLSKYCIRLNNLTIPNQQVHNLETYLSNNPQIENDYYVNKHSGDRKHIFIISSKAMAKINTRVVTAIIYIVDNTSVLTSEVTWPPPLPSPPSPTTANTCLSAASIPCRMPMPPVPVGWERYRGASVHQHVVCLSAVERA